METPLNSQSLEAMFGPGKTNKDGTITWDLTGDAMSKLGINVPHADPAAMASPFPPTPPPVQSTETVGPPVFIPSSKGRVLQSVLLSGILLVALLQFAVSVATLVLLASGPAR